ncbi:hypothetical protein [Eoetvoesiella caeni]|uniref:Uncharacterized protein n=1 Tax=Eoetvoesiella caeni TaxID=645616 RepID=A0A366HK24_9BURK|nr:hypothetical protein [Eoetvoesiella caeni]MCI2807381.1 hypothetical protein [Eoetvoesiella caeni]NYT53224.1 hypothetical protein [Eoetvoesiella caeni]RBP43204.1 hypothetical protein DFR37_101332 [Eoetvoesiella caeni]
MNIGGTPMQAPGRYLDFLWAHVPPNPEPDHEPGKQKEPPSIPPEAPDEVDLPPRETPQKIDDPDPGKSRNQP